MISAICWRSESGTLSRPGVLFCADATALPASVDGVRAGGDPALPPSECTLLRRFGVVAFLSVIVGRVVTREIEDQCIVYNEVIEIIKC